MKVIGFIPSLERPLKLHNLMMIWTFICYETKFGSHTELAAQKALRETERQASLKAVHDQILVKAAVEYVRKIDTASLFVALDKSE